MNQNDSKSHEREAIKAEEPELPLVKTMNKYKKHAEAYDRRKAIKLPRTEPLSEEHAQTNDVKNPESLPETSTGQRDSNASDSHCETMSTPERTGNGGNPVPTIQIDSYSVPAADSQDEADDREMKEKAAEEDVEPISLKGKSRGRVSHAISNLRLLSLELFTNVTALVKLKRQVRDGVENPKIH